MRWLPADGQQGGVILRKLLFDPNSKICCCFAWRKATENFDCYYKMGKGKFCLKFLEPAPGEIVFFDFLKAKNEEKLKCFMIFPLSTLKPF